MADKPILEPVRFGNDSFYILKDNKFVVEVRNSGTDCNKETTTQVKFEAGGNYKEPNNRAPQSQLTEPLAAEKSVKLEFDAPADKCFIPDCVFYITVDVNNVLGEDPTTRSNATRGVCKAMFPCLVVIPNEQGAFATLEGEQLKFVVQNQGTAYARPSKTRVNLEDIGEVVVPTDGLEPGYSTNVLGKIEQIAYAKGKLLKGAPLKCKISLDVDEVVHVANDNKKLVHRVFEGSITMKSEPSK